MLFLAMKSVLDGYREIRENGDIPAAIDSPDLNGVRTIGVCDGIEREAVADGGRRMWPVIGHVRARSTVNGSSGQHPIHIDVHLRYGYVVYRPTRHADRAGECCVRGGGVYPSPRGGEIPFWGVFVRGLKKLADVRVH